MDTYNLIILGIDHVKFSSRVGADAKDLICQLCRWGPRALPCPATCSVGSGLTSPSAVPTGR